MSTKDAHLKEGGAKFTPIQGKGAIVGNTMDQPVEIVITGYYRGEFSLC